MNVDNWMSGLQAGRSFATTGPMMDMSLNGELVGSELQLASGDAITISVTADINPQIDLLDRLQLYKHGDLVAETESKPGANSLSLHYAETANAGAWFVAVALGKARNDGAVAKAVTSPIYVRVGDSGFCKPSAVESIAERMHRHLDAIHEPSVQQLSDVRPWVTIPVRQRIWSSNASAVAQHAQAAKEQYARLAALAKHGRCREASEVSQQVNNYGIQ